MTEHGRSSRSLGRIGARLGWVAIAGCIAAGSGCSSDSGSTPPADTAPPIADLAVADLGAAINYPAGPYGTKKGEVAENMSFLGFKDPNTFCQLEKNLALDTGKKVAVSFGDFHNRVCEGTGKLAKPKQLLWVMVSAG
ncbi:MAG: hypothetical protein KC503_15785 [Myxococcales bacterium]|nr:hypothetical protein [Myxococcales bacterium]